MAHDKQLETLDGTIALQERSLGMARNLKEGVRATELAVQRFQAEVRKNQSQKLIIRQQIIETENQVDFLLGRYPQPVERDSTGFIDKNLRTLQIGIPSQLLMNRPDIREAERNLQAAGLDIRFARANFYPKLFINGTVGYEAFNTKYLFISPTSLIYSVAGDLVAPVINKAAIRADYMSQRQAIAGALRVSAHDPGCLYRGDQPDRQGAKLQPEHRAQEAAGRFARIGRRGRHGSVSICSRRIPRRADRPA